MKCPLCKGTGLDPRADHTSQGLTACCRKCNGAGQVRSYEKIVDTNPTSPPKVLRTKWDPSFTMRKDWRWWADVVIRRLRKMVRVVDEALFAAEKHVQPKGSLLKYDLPINKIIEDQSIKDIQAWEDKGPLADGRWRDDYVERAREELDGVQRVNTKRVCKMLMDRVRKSWLQMYPRNPEMLLRVVEAHNEELKKLGVRVPTHIQVDQLPGLEPITFQVELVLDGYKEAHIFTLGGGDQCGS